MISGQALFQIIACLVLHYCLESILKQSCVGLTQCNLQHAERSTIVFNTFVFCQIFNQLSESRSEPPYAFLERELTRLRCSRRLSSTRPRTERLHRLLPQPLVPGNCVSNFSLFLRRVLSRN